MMVYLPDLPQFLVFLTASFLLGMTPGPDLLLVASRAMSQGSRAGFVTLAGISMGCCVHVAAASLGIGLVITRTPWLFDLIRFAGCAYLLWMAISIARAKPGLEVDDGMARRRPWTLFRQALLTNLLNPKVVVFMLAFLPQFVPASSPNSAISTAALGMMFVGLGWLIMGAAALGFGRISGWLMDRPRVMRAQNLVTGALLTLFAGYLAASGSR